ILTPILLLSIFLPVVKSAITPLGLSGPALQEYQTSLTFKGLLEGYLTMDTISALAFGMIGVHPIRPQGVYDRKSISIATAQAGRI
ncbi:branched-chain amino acid transport system II carrier protein, partial [Bacillus thuringiensis]|uniref:branched-chain amino acid transport system II carrier protein n=1 Tax=Bacillus thuringiensis TaxID=1428 RepID=UPI00284124B7